MEVSFWLTVQVDMVHQGGEYMNQNQKTSSSAYCHQSESEPTMWIWG